MCIILSIHQKEKDPAIQQTLLMLIESLKKSHADGVGIVASNKDDDQVFTQRALTLPAETISRLFLEYDTINIHLRQATAGIVNQENCHFWKRGDWFFAHNGTVMKSEATRGGKFTDSYLFYKEMLDKEMLKRNGKFNWKNINQLKEDKNLWGRIVLYNKRTRQNLFFGDFYSYSINRKVLLVSTAKIDFNYNVNLLGLNFNSTGPYEVLSEELEGIFAIDTKKSTAKAISDKFGVPKPVESRHYSEYDNWGRYNGHQGEMGFLPTVREADKQVDDVLEKLQEEADGISILQQLEDEKKIARVAFNSYEIILQEAPENKKAIQELAEIAELAICDYFQTYDIACEMGQTPTVEEGFINIREQLQKKITNK